MKTISKEYRDLQAKLHQDDNSYGMASTQFAPLIHQLVTDLKISSISDYGAGKRRLENSLKELNTKYDNYYPYDPAFPEYGDAQKGELVCCIDVLEHIEPELIDNVLSHLHSITNKWIFMTIHQIPARKILSDGRNAHLILESTSWWLEKIIKKFDVFQLQKHEVMGQGIFILATPIK
jgi:hypothetical protein